MAKSLRLSDPTCLTLKQAADVLAVSLRTVERLVKLWHTSGGEDGLRSLWVGGSRRVLREDILAFLAAQVEAEALQRER